MTILVAIYKQASRCVKFVYFNTMAFKYPSVSLNSGHSMPIFGLGTWRSEPTQVTEAVKDAIDAGYRHIDCAMVYGNETEVGEAIKTKIADGTVKREDLFITSKLWSTMHSTERVLPALKNTLSDLGLTYVDLYLIHWPIGFKEGGENMPKDDEGKVLFSSIDYVETWTQMEEAVEQGLAKSIGVSNFNKEQIERVIAHGTIMPANNQVESHPYLVQKKLIDFCSSKGITVTAYSPLGSPDRPFAKQDEPAVMADPKVVAMAERHGKTAAQILIKFQVQRGVICIPKSVTKSRIIANGQILDFELTSEDMDTLGSLDCNVRLCSIEWSKDHEFYPFNAEF